MSKTNVELPAPADGRHAPPESMQRDFRNSARARVSPIRPLLSQTVGAQTL